MRPTRVKVQDWGSYTDYQWGWVEGCFMLDTRTDGRGAYEQEQVLISYPDGELSWVPMYRVRFDKPQEDVL